MCKEKRVSLRGGLITEYREVAADEWVKMRAAAKEPAVRQMVGLLFAYNGILPEHLTCYSRQMKTNQSFRKAGLPYRVRSTKWAVRPRFYELHTTRS
jgi:hypothetical protein